LDKEAEKKARYDLVKNALGALTVDIKEQTVFK
jgi:hypothetical protein